MTGYHTRWVRPETEADDPERLAIRESWLSARHSMTGAPPSA